jgi:hypothetical protein
MEAKMVDVYDYPEHTFMDYGLEARCRASSTEITYGEMNYCAMTAVCPKCDQTVIPLYMGEFPL